MLPKGLDEKLLRYMYRQHVREHGHRVTNLAESKLIVTAGQGLERQIPGILIESNGMKKYLVVPAAQELEQRGFVEFDRENVYFWLTPRGYAWAARSVPRRSLDFLNSNAGLSIPIALLALIVSVFALAWGGT